MARTQSAVASRPDAVLRLQQAAGNRSVLAMLARTPDDDDPGFSGDPNEAQKIGSAGEHEEIGRVRQELEAKGYDLIYDRHDIARMKRNIAAGRPNRPPYVDEWLTEVFPDGRARPEIVAIDTKGKRILVLDLTARPGSSATPKPGDVSKLPSDAPAAERSAPHLDKTKGYAERTARGRPKWYSDYTVSAQDRYWTTGKYSVEVKVPPPQPSRWDPTAGPPDVPTRKGPNFQPQPYDPDRPAKTTSGPAPDAPAPTPAPDAPTPSRGGADTAAPTMEIEGGRVKLYRGVGPAEASEVMRHGDFSYSPHGGGKYFAFTKKDAVNAAKVLYPEGATIIETSVPRAYVPDLPDAPMRVHHPHIGAREPATLIEGEVLSFYDPRAGGWSLHVDDSALDIMNSQMTKPTIHESSFPIIGAAPPPAGGGHGEEQPKKPPPEHPSAAGEHPSPAPAAGEIETLAPSAVPDDFVPKLAAEHEALVLKPGRYVRIGGAVYAVMMIGGVLFFINDVIAKGPIEAGKEWGLMAILTETIAQSFGGAIAGVVGIVIFMPSDQAGHAERIAKAEVIDSLIYKAFPGVVTDKKLLCIGHCTAANREVEDTKRYYQLVGQISALVANAWEIEDDDTVRRRRRKEVVAEEHRREEEHDLAERVRFDKELAGYREAMQRPVGFYVRASVGEEGTNNPDDVKRTAKRLHELGFLDQVTDDVDALGDAIYTYQSAVLHLPKPDGRIDPRGKTEKALRAGRKISMKL